MRDTLIRYIQANIEGIRWALNPANKAAMMAILADTAQADERRRRRNHLQLPQKGFATDAQVSTSTASRTC